MMRKSFLLLIVLAFGQSLFAQTLEELNAQKAEKEAVAAGIASEIAAIDAQIAALPGWRKGSFGTIGLNLANFSNWVTQANPNSSATTIVGSFNGFANLIQDKFFWRNSGNIAVGWQKLQTDKTDPSQPSGFEQTTDVIQLTSLYGRNMTETIALSALGEFRSTVLNNALNPGYLDIGVGATWTPTPPLVVVVHPLNYNFVIAKDRTQYQSSLGAKLVADYAQEIASGVNLRTNLTSFLSYEDFENLSNFTWTSGLGFTAFKGIGVGLEYAIRLNRQETNAAGSDTERQNYWVIGLSYSL